MKKLLILCILIGVIPMISLSDRPPNPTLKEELVGSWIGYEQSYPYFYRLRLNPDDTGTVVVVYPEGRPTVYSFKWKFSNPSFKFSASRVGKPDEQIVCEIRKADHLRMQFEMGGPKGDWKRAGELFSEKEMNAKIRQAEHE